MPNYIRAFVPGGTFFFTVNLLERRRRLLTDYIDDLRIVFTDASHCRPFTIDVIVVLPDQLHSVWTLPVGDGDFSTRWYDIKARFSARFSVRIPKHERLSRRRARVGGERGIWQRRFWEYRIRDEGDLQRPIDYVHYNPVKHGHVSRLIDRPYSSFHRYVKAGLYQPHWAADDVVKALALA